MSFVAVALLTLFVESTLLLAFLRGQWSAAAVALVHGLVVAGIGLFLLRASRCGSELRDPLLLLISTAFLGPLGAVGTLWCLVLTSWFRHSALSFQEWYDSLFPQQKTSFADQIYHQIKATEVDLNRADLPIPFVDIMSVGSRLQKQTVIGLIGKNFQPVFAQTLLMALRDDNSAIRVQAATTMARLENQFLEKTLELTASVEKSGEDPDQLKRLAHHYDDYAFTGILDAAREQENRLRATEIYQKYLLSRPEDMQARTAVGRLLVRQRRFDEAQRWLQDAVEKGSVTNDTLLWLSEAEFRLGRWDRVRTLFQTHARLLSAQDLPEQVASTVQLWLKGTQANEQEPSST